MSLTTDTTEQIVEKPKKYLIIGMSHTACISRALANRPDIDNVAVVNLRDNEMEDEDFEWPLQPDVVCLSIAGNHHNTVALFERPLPFTIGGVVFDDRRRVSIPTQVMKDSMDQRLEPTKEMTEKLHAAFPDAEFRHLCSPPPLSDTSRIQLRSAMFDATSKFGYAPNGLRMMAYNMQCDWYRDLAAKSGATFLPPPSEAITEDGMLAVEYSGRDPTHGNPKYGQLILDQILNGGN
jgi:hypothetical protein